MQVMHISNRNLVSNASSDFTSLENVHLAKDRPKSSVTVKTQLFLNFQVFLIIHSV